MAFSLAPFIRCSREGKRGIEKERLPVAASRYFISLHFSQCRVFSPQSPSSLLTEPSLFFAAFRDLRPVSLEKGQETLRLRVYACYAWGGPFLVAGLAALLDHLPPQPQYTFLRPRFGEKQCWFYGKFLTSSVEPLVISARTILWTRELAPSTRYPTSSPRHIIGSRQICISPEIIRNY